MSEHVFHFYGPVTPFSFEQLRTVILTAIQQQGCTKATILLSSEGGSLTAGLTAYNFLRALPVPVKAINMSNVESIAVMLYLAADERLVTENSRFLLHSFHWGVNAGTLDHNRISEYSASLTFDAERYAKIFEARTNGAQAPINIRECLHSGAFIVDTSTAVSAGISNSVVPPEGIISSDAIHWWPTTVG